MKFRLDEMVQRDFNYAIVDEVDSILVDEARTPLIISGPTEDLRPLSPRQRGDPGARSREARLREGREAAHRHLTEAGARRSRSCCARPACSPRATSTTSRTSPGAPRQPGAARAQAVHARRRLHRQGQDKVIIIDEFTGRMMEGRRYSDGLHQALEAKEGVTVQPRTRRSPRSPSRTTSGSIRSSPA
jgi:preprotein translocase subunit SecA